MTIRKTYRSIPEAGITSYRKIIQNTKLTAVSNIKVSFDPFQNAKSARWVPCTSSRKLKVGKTKNVARKWRSQGEGGRRLRRLSFVVFPKLECGGGCRSSFIKISKQALNVNVPFFNHALAGPKNPGTSWHARSIWVHALVGCQWR